MTASKSNKPNLDLIDMVQRARMMHDAAAKPSEISGNYWIEAKPHGEALTVTAQSGYWRIMTSLQDVDALWEVIKQATEQGRLGYKAKVSTSPAPGQADSQVRSILVCTRDADDADDVQRVYEVLQLLGITAEMRYERQ